MALHRLGLCALLLAGVAAPGWTDGLDLRDGRFHVTAQWETTGHAPGVGQGVALTAEAGYFWFFAPTNVELTVKILDACDAFHRFWVFAAGMTDTAVTLTVEDRWSGRVRTYQRAGGALFAPLADTASFDTCAAPPACGKGSPGDILASPRPDTEAEELAVLVGKSVVAEEAVYQRVRSDLAAIRGQEPSLQSQTFLNTWWDSHSLLVDLTDAAAAQARAGTYHEWDCLQTWYRAVVREVSPYSSWVTLAFEGVIAPQRVGLDYVDLPGVIAFEPNYLAYPSGGPVPTPGLCASTDDGVAYEYFFEARSPSPARYFRVPFPGAPPILVGTWLPPAPPPSWQGKLDACWLQLGAP